MGTRFTPDTPRETKLKVIAATAEGILHDLDGLLMGAYNIYDVAKAIPHPYDALGGMGSHFLHDFRGTASKIATYIELVKRELEESTRGTTDGHTDKQRY